MEHTFAVSPGSLMQSTTRESAKRVDTGFMIRRAGLLLILGASTVLPDTTTAQFIQQGTKLFGTGVASHSAQGVSVSLSADGSTALVGGPVDSGAIGASWVYTRSNNVWTQQGGKLVGTDAAGFNSYQGGSVSLSSDGNTALVGGYFDNGFHGAAWVYSRNGGVWTQQGAKLVASDATGSAEQGTSVSLSADGNTAIVGGRTDNNGWGAAWVYTRSADVWTQQGSKLVGTGVVGNGAWQGCAVAISADGNTAIVGGLYDNLVFPDSKGAGAAWIFTRSGGVWAQQGNKLVGTGAVGQASRGASVAISADGNTAIVGGPDDNTGAGAAWVFTRSGGVWTQQGNKLVGTGAFGPAGQGGSVSLSADGNTAIIGGSADSTTAGAVWVYKRSAGVWTQQGSKLVGTGAVGAARQGISVSISGDGSTAIVGGSQDSSGAGAAWVYVQNPVFSLSVQSISFGAVAPGDSTRDTVRVHNMGGGTLNISSIASDNPAFGVEPTSGVVAPGDSLAVAVTFIPNSVATFNAHVVFVHDGMISSDTLALAGIGTYALASGDYTIGLSLFNRLTGKHLVHARATRTVIRELPVSSPDMDGRDSHSLMPGRKPAMRRVPMVEACSILTEEGHPYTGPQYIHISNEARRRLGLKDALVGSYATVTAALADLDTSGLLGHVRFLLADSSYPSETFPLDVKVSAPDKPNPLATITLKPNVGVSAHIEGLSPTDDPILRVRADYVTIDGSNTDGGTTRDLAITNYNGVAIALSVWDLMTFPDDTVSHVTIKNTVLADTSGGSATLTVGPSFAYASGRYSDIVVENNEIHGGKFGMWISGMELNPGSNVIVRNNVIQGVHGIGIIAKYSHGVAISGNDLSSFVPVFFGYLEGIRSELGATNVIVEQNVVHDLGNSASGFPGGNGIVVMTLDSLPNVLVRNNLIYGMTGAGASFSWTNNPMGIRVQAPAGGVKVYNNSIFLSGSTLSEANALSMGIAVGSGGRPDIRNNIIVNNLGLAGGMGIGSCGVYYQDTTNLASTLDHNLYNVNPAGTGVKAIGVIDTSPSTTLAAWQSVTGQEAHSVVGDPLFVSTTDLHVSGPGSPASNAGGPLGDVTRDFDNEIRSTLSPDIGADEFAPVPTGVAVALASGWNMLSNPITTPNDSVRQLYPASAFGYAFSFSSTAGYQQSYRMNNGRGYWAKLVSGGTQTLLGPPRTGDSVTVSAGWNMVGSISYPVDTAAVTSVPPGIRTSQWYGYGPGYNPSAQIVPGKAYWVKSNTAGKFVFSITPEPPSVRRTARDRNILAELNTLTITDAAGASQTLYFGSDTKGTLPIGVFEMPPAPPLGALDVRFETPRGGLMVQTHDVGGGSFPITLQAGQYPLTVTWNVREGSAGYTLRDVNKNSVHLEGRGTWRIANSSVNRLVLETSGGPNVPEEFALFQNYPNPFNPSTTIRFALPVAGRVTAEIFNILGQRVRSLVDEDLPAGYHTAEWNGTGNAGQQLGSGAYFVRLTAASATAQTFTDFRKLVLMK